MARILFWNLLAFAAGKIDSANAEKGYGPELNLDYIVKVVKTVDIFVLLELKGGPIPTVGSLLPSSGTRQGLLMLLNALNGLNAGKVGGPTGGTVTGPWYLVPPVVTGQDGNCEAVGVFYNSKAVSFTGPWEWDQGTGQVVATSSSALPDKASRGYGNWQTLPEIGPKTKLPGGQWEFKNGSTPIEFPDQVCRRPWRVTFKENTTNRNLDIFAFHAAFGKGGKVAALAVEKLKEIDELKSPVPVNTVRILGGDFNVDSKKNPKIYDDLAIHTKMKWALAPNLSNPYNLATTIRAVWNPSIKENNCLLYEKFPQPPSVIPQPPSVIPQPPSVIPQPPSAKLGYYPYYYYGSSTYDHIFINEGAVIKKVMIINQINGVNECDATQPSSSVCGYGFPAGPAVNDESRKYTYPCIMWNDVPDILKTAEGDADKANGWFNATINYGKIRSTSDHLGVMIEV